MFHVGAPDPMGTDLTEVVFIPVEHRISIVYAKHDNMDVGGRETAISETGPLRSTTGRSWNETPLFARLSETAPIRAN